MIELTIDSIYEVLTSCLMLPIYPMKVSIKHLNSNEINILNF